MEVLTFALLAILIGMRHGIDTDHVAAIADMVGSEKETKKRISLGMMYAFGHGCIVFIIGLLAILIGMKISPSIRQWMEAGVGITLLALGTFVLYSVFFQKKDYEHKSRMQLVYESLTKLFAKDKTLQKSKWNSAAVGVISAFFIGMIHGIGVESPTQIMLITNVSGLNHTWTATIQLILFVIGLLISTIGITFCLSWGFMKAGFQRILFYTLGLATGLYSICLGVTMLFETWKGGI